MFPQAWFSFHLFPSDPRLTALAPPASGAALAGSSLCSESSARFPRRLVAFKALDPRHLDARLGLFQVQVQDMGNTLGSGHR